MSTFKAMNEAENSGFLLQFSFSSLVFFLVFSLAFPIDWPRKISIIKIESNGIVV